MYQELLKTGDYYSFLFKGVTYYSAFQKIVDRNLNIIGYEMLSRPYKGDSSLSPAQQFDGMSLDDVISLDTSLAYLHLSNFVTNNLKGTCFINILPQVALTLMRRSQFSAPDYLLKIQEVGADASRICFEFVENKIDEEMLLHKLATVKHVPNSLRALDDLLLTDKNALRRIANMPFDIIKFDRQNLLYKSSKELIETIDILTPNCSYFVIEGVEEIEQMEPFLSLDNCYFQGFGIERPQIMM